ELRELATQPLDRKVTSRRPVLGRVIAPAKRFLLRLLRPLQAPPQKDREKFWRADLKQVQEDVDFRIQEEGRGALGYVDPTLPKAIKDLKERKSNKKK
ncbi:MAG: hypothetical protein GY888_04740, partial [Planctomycetaceae bacterium]|nr:hypothetical protein [Planctomycetaceae bacterium]